MREAQITGNLKLTIAPQITLTQRECQVLHWTAEGAVRYWEARRC
jgi:hypothetical protein